MEAALEALGGHFHPGGLGQEVEEQHPVGPALRRKRRSHHECLAVPGEEPRQVRHQSLASVAHMWVRW